jgi:hypothetical protein
MKETLQSSGAENSSNRFPGTATQRFSLGSSLYAV